MILSSKIHFNRFTLSFITLFVSLLAIQISTPKAEAAYDGSRIIDNAVFLDARSMSANDVQSFLSSKGGQLASKSFVLNCDMAGTQAKQAYLSQGAPCGQSIPAAQIIYYAAQVYGISPKVILATLQKEQSLVTAVNPTDRQYAQAMGYACPTSGNCSDSSNFFWQVDNGTWVLRFHMERARGNNNWWYTTTSWTCGSEKNFYKPNLYPNQNVNFYDENGVMYRTHFIANAATSSMYCYTPHAYNNPQGLYGRAPFGTTGMYYSGSYNFVTFFELWFGSTQTNIPYAWQLVSQEAYSDPQRTKPFTTLPTSTPGTNIYMRVVARNNGFQTWNKSTVKIGTSAPQERLSAFYDSSWQSASRPAVMKEETVIPGDSATFEFTLKSPEQTGTRKEYFNLLAEGITWMNDPGMYYLINTISTSPPINTTGTSLTAGQTLVPGQYIMSTDTHSLMVLEGSGELVVYRNFIKVWSSGTANKNAANAILQTDGNFVIYSKSGVPLWASQTFGNNNSSLVSQTDGNFVIYNAVGQPVWSSSTNHNPSLDSYTTSSLSNSFIYPKQRLETSNRNYRLVQQEDGNLVLYTKQNRALWSSNTFNRNVSYTAMQSDGNLVVYGTNGQALWNSGTGGNTNTQLVVQEDGNLVIYRAPGGALWDSRTRQ